MGLDNTYIEFGNFTIHLVPYPQNFPCQHFLCHQNFTIYDTRLSRTVCTLCTYVRMYVCMYVCMYYVCTMYVCMYVRT